jgi:hypothetical protein
MKTAVVRSANVTRQKAVCLQWILLNIFHASHRTRVILQRRLCIVNQTKRQHCQLRELPLQNSLESDFRFRIPLLL